VKKQDKKTDERGWEALKKMLQERGVTSPELEEAQNCFYQGIEVLAKLFLSCYLPEENKNKHDKSLDKT